MLVRSEQLDALGKALASAQGELQNASKSQNNPFFNSKYADLAEVLGQVRPVFSKYGLSVSQHPDYMDGVVTVETILLHSSGQWLSSSVASPVTKRDPQGVGSAITYCRRYAVAAVAGLAQEDDDGNSASHPAKNGRDTGVPAAQRKPQEPPPPPPPESQDDGSLVWSDEDRERANQILFSFQDWCETEQVPAHEMAKVVKTARENISAVPFEKWNNRMVAAADRIEKKWVKK